MRALMAVGLLVGCMSGAPRASSRWPVHRREHDARLEQLERQRLDERVKELERRVHELEATLSRLQPAAPHGVDETAPPQSKPTIDSLH